MYTQRFAAAWGETDRLPGTLLFSRDVHFFGNRRFAAELFDGMKGMGRIWQAAGTVNSVLDSHLIESAAACGLRSLFVGFDSINTGSLKEQRKHQNLPRSRAQRNAAAAVFRSNDD